MENCVKKVMAQGRDKKAAIAICYASLMRKENDEMSRKNDKQARAARLEQKANREKKAELLRRFADEIDAPGEPELEVSETAVPGTQYSDALAPEAKHYGGDMPAMPMPAYGGATSFAEMDSYMAARDQANQVSDLSYTFRELVDNIMADGEVADKATAIASLAGEFQARVKNPPESKAGPNDDPLPDPDESDEEGGEDEPELASIEAKLKEPGIAERVRDAIASLFKAEISSAAMNDLPDSAFAYIEPGGKKDESGKTVPRSLRHYPIHDKPHVRNGLARAAAQIKKGGQGADIAHRAMPKIRAAAKRMGIGAPAEGKSAFYVLKQKDGGGRWVAWVSNNFRDRDYAKHPTGEIISEAAHKEFVQFLDANPQEAPQWWSWHVPVRKSRADWWDYADGFLLMSGPMTAEEFKAYSAEDALVGTSHGFYVLRRDDASGVIGQYRTFEVSDLPLEVAANPYTAFETIRKELTAMPFDAKRRQYLVSKVGEEEVKRLEASTKELADALVELGVERKEVSENSVPSTQMTAETAMQPPGAAQGAQEALKVIVAELLHPLEGKVDALAAQVSGKSAAEVQRTERVQHLLRQVDALTAEVKELQGEQPRAAAKGYRASQDAKTITADKGAGAGPSGDEYFSEFIGELLGTHGAAPAA